MSRRGWVVAALMLSTVGSAGADQPVTPVPTQDPRPAPELDGLKPMEGTWTCVGTLMASPGMPAHAIKGTLKVRRDLDRFWLSVRVDHQKTPSDPLPYRAHEMLTFDGAAKQWTRRILDNFGGWGSATSAGWDGDKLVWNGEYTLPGMAKTAYRQTFTRKGRELQNVIEINNRVMLDERCRK